MKRFTIQNLTLTLNNKDKINILNLEFKNNKYILYSTKNTEIVNNNDFIKFEFKENIQITPKKKMVELNLITKLNDETKLNELIINNNAVYYLKDSRNIILNNDKLFLILQDGKLYESVKNNYDKLNDLSPKNNLLESKESEKNIDIVSEILNKSRNSNGIMVSSITTDSDKSVLSEEIFEKIENKNILVDNENNDSSIKIINLKNNDNIKVGKKDRKYKSSEEIIGNLCDFNVKNDLSNEKYDIQEITEENNVNEMEENNVNKIEENNVNKIEENNNIEINVNDANKIEENNNIEINVNDVNEIKENNNIIADQRLITDNYEKSILDKSTSEIIVNIENKINDSDEIINSSITLDSEKSISEFVKVDNNTKNIKIIDNNLLKYDIQKIESSSTMASSQPEKIQNNLEKENKNNKKEINTEIFNLEKILTDFNKLFDFNDKTNTNDKNIDKNSNKETTVINKNNEISENFIKIIEKETTNNIKKEEVKTIIKKIEQKNNYVFYIKTVNYQNINYKLQTIKLKSSNDLNFINLFKTKVEECNTISKNNLSFELDEENSSYLILYMNQKYLINKINSTIVLTNLVNRNSQIIKNKDNFKIGLNDFILYNNASIIIPATVSKFFDNNYGTSFNVYTPLNI
jgi:hypothetical protein